MSAALDRGLLAWSSVVEGLRDITKIATLDEFRAVQRQLAELLDELDDDADRITPA